MLAQGPVPRALHGLIEYAAGVLFIVAPFLLGFSDDGVPTATSIVVGILVLLVAATTKGSTSLVDVIPTSLHVTVDYVLAALLVAAPFAFGFSDESAPTAFFITLGVVHLLLTVATRFVTPQR